MDKMKFYGRRLISITNDYRLRENVKSRRRWKVGVCFKCLGLWLDLWVFGNLTRSPDVIVACLHSFLSVNVASWSVL